MILRDEDTNIRDNRPSRKQPPGLNSSLSRASRILLSISNSIDTNVDIAGACHLSTSTTHRILKTLRHLNWVVQDEANHRYYLGPMIMQISSNRIATHRSLIIDSLREMGRLSDLTRETILLSTMVDYHYILLHDIPSSLQMKITDEGIGHGQLFRLGAIGKVLLSQLSDREINRVLERFELIKSNERSITDKKVLKEQLKEIRRRGYGISCGERITGATCISAPIAYYTYPAAISVLGPENRLTQKMDETTCELLASAGQISRITRNSEYKGGNRWMDENST